MRRLPPPKILLPGLLALFLVAAAVGGLVVSFDEPYYHWRVVEPGRVYRCGTLGEGDLGRAIDRHGIRTVVNLRSVEERSKGDWYEQERRVAAERGVRLLDVPLPEGQPPTPDQVERILAAFDEAASRPVLFHCEHGVTRSAAVEGLYRREYLRETPEEAVRRVAVFGRDMEAKYPQIVRFIREYVPRATPRAER